MRTGKYYISFIRKMEENDNVLYCRNCLSLRIMQFQSQDFCDKCGSTDIGEVSIDEWQELCKSHGESSLIVITKKTTNGRKE